MDRMAVKLSRLGKLGYGVEMKSAEYLIDPDFDSDEKNSQHCMEKQRLTRRASEELRHPGWIPSRPVVCSS